MKYYNTIQRVTIDNALIERARAFSGRVVPTTDYSDSNQTYVEKVKEDHFISKLGEEAAKAVMSLYGLVTGPDYTIYNAQQKSWDDDLYINRVGLAIKTQKRSMALRFGLSWTFQSGPSREDIILRKPDAWVVFVEYDDALKNVCYVYPPFQMKELVLGEPRLERLKGSKKVVYANTLRMQR